MNDLNAELGQLAKSISKWNGRHNRIVKGQMEAIKHEQTMRRKGLRTQGVFIECRQTENTLTEKMPKTIAANAPYCSKKTTTGQGIVQSCPCSRIDIAGTVLVMNLYRK
jgi:hypothetical protein